MWKRLLLLVLSVMSLSAAAAPAILIYGDSLSAGYGIGVEQSWPALLAKRLEDNRLRYTVSNASISGETTAGGRSRFDEALNRVQPEVVVIALGANDGLRGLPAIQMRMNLTAMVKAAKARKARVLLVGMKLPPNYGPVYARQFEESFPTVSRAENVPLLPFLLEPLGTDIDYFQADGLHPTAAAQPRLLDHVWPALKPLLR
ncbi:MAG: arylesterase [Rhodocyclales bacterium]|nr:arylesterase [Rhodocyclales bacterium]